ncbi:UDP-4-amino-4,6-dideoxy-N-acetyl-beta-L-altrosamine transaminase [Polynucleobacter bastaniensis]|uniref:UDP-4-amino-4, 6-dideoxy-N-acetyl-beta-L-altrosamine transaminase n=1 Tax=Polynucleobacter bastaniensis TaxID=2081039 RepID=UPI001C0DCCBA|nr:UDP-4-amino-4,6-dideoxy-N-acetyl-beta-L-altrosamine transaminase [Polynucleobacter bastaniensis]MBU3597319.1 UDP-4-amino-4,6-dideoxy-N-acetyl-beta-L-altrosamine transaminase [Polynucleobacter bastaniensis]
MIPYGKHHIDEEDIQAVVNVLRSGILTQGPIIEQFEQEIARYVGSRYAVAVSSATAGMHLAAIAAGVGPGSTLITSPITFVASANAGLYAGGNVAFADIDPQTINMSPKSLKIALENNPNTKAVIPVHFGGLPCDMTAIKLLADNAGAVIIEDGAHALGASYPDGGKVGSCLHSLMTIFSFHPVKAIAAGEGGMITTNDEVVYRKLLRLRSHGINKLDDALEIPSQAQTKGEANPWYYEMQELGFHYRITEMQCALALSQFKKLDQFILRRRILAKKYDEAFAVFKNCWPAQSMGRDFSGHHLYVLRIDFTALGMNRAQLMKELKERDIGSQVHYIPVPMQPYYQKQGLNLEDFPGAINYYEEALSIPLFYDLTDAQQEYIVTVFKDLVG